MIDRKLYDQYVSILKEELVPAMGCTEPVAIAYAGAIARDALGKMPESACIRVSGNIIKNVKTYPVPFYAKRDQVPNYAKTDPVPFSWFIGKTIKNLNIYV